MRRRDLPVARHELEAAALRLSGEGAGQRQDRPQAQHEREEDAVLVLEVAAQGVDVDDLAGHALEDRRHGVDEVLELVTRLRRVELGGDGPADAEEDERQQDTGDDRRPPRVADGLGEDAAEAVDAAPGRRGGRGRLRCGRSSGRRLGRALAVLGQEGLLERRLAADEVGQVVPRGRADDGRDAAGDAHAQGVVLGDDVGHAGQRAELLQRHLVR